MKKALIVFPDPWLKYSPFTLNLATCLEPDHKVKIICGGNPFFDNDGIPGDIKILHTSKFMAWVYRKLHISKLVEFMRFFIFILWNKIRFNKYDLVLGIDPIGYLVSRIFYKNAVYVSLEVPKNNYQKLCEKIGVKRLVILTEERKEYLFPNRSDIVTHYVVNSPILQKEAIINKTERNFRLLHLGNTNSYQHLEEYIDTLKLLDKKYTLTLKGFITENYKAELFGKYSDLFQNKRIILNTDYIEQDKIVDLVSNYYIGFAFYNFDHVGRDNFNLLSTTSGKLLNYIAGGIPVIAHDIIGFQFVRKYNCGILLEHPSVEALKKAIEEIEKNYDLYSKNCNLAAKELDFKRMFDVFLKDYYNN